jgi:hypothetical protein
MIMVDGLYVLALVSCQRRCFWCADRRESPQGYRYPQERGNYDNRGCDILHSVGLINSQVSSIDEFQVQAEDVSVFLGEQNHPRFGCLPKILQCALEVFRSGSDDALMYMKDL